jgi:hypothetical protein
VSPVIRATLLYLLGSIVVVLHILGYAQPGLIVSSRLVNWVAIPLLLGAMFLLPRTIKVPPDAWKKDPVIKWGSLGLALLAAVEALLYAALMFNILARFDPKYLAVDSNPAFSMLETRLGHLMVFSVLGSGLWPLIVTGLRDVRNRGGIPVS